MTRAILAETSFVNADLAACRVYGISAWNVHLVDAIQTNLRITPDEEAEIRVDNLEVAQFLYLMLHHETIGHVIETCSSNVVLILGRFTFARKEALKALREAVRRRTPPYMPVFFDVAESSARDVPALVTRLARLARFVIADMTDPANIAQQLQAIVPHIQAPVLPIIAEDAIQDAIVAEYRNFSWVLHLYRYSDLNDLVAAVGETIIASAEAKIQELQCIPHRSPMTKMTKIVTIRTNPGFSISSRAQRLLKLTLPLADARGVLGRTRRTRPTCNLL